MIGLIRLQVSGEAANVRRMVGHKAGAAADCRRLKAPGGAQAGRGLLVASLGLLRAELGCYEATSSAASSDGEV